MGGASAPDPWSIDDIKLCTATMDLGSVLGRRLIAVNRDPRLVELQQGRAAHCALTLRLQLQATSHKLLFFLGGSRPQALLENKKIFFLTISHNILYLNYEIKRSIAASWRPFEAVQNAGLVLWPAGCGMQNRFKASEG